MEWSQHIEYTRTVVPSSMRSSYWKYFGFPSDNSNNVLTRQKIVCTLCGAVIAYNRNTSNLRTHIVARHPQLLLELCNEKSKKESLASAHILKVEAEPAVKRPKTFYLQSANETKANAAYVTATSEPGTSDLNNEGIIEVNEVIDQSDDKTDNNSDYDDYAGSITQNTEYTFEEIENNCIKVGDPLENTEELLAEMLVADLQSPSLVEEAGFTKLAVSLGVPPSSLKKNIAEQFINKLFDESFDKICKELRTITNTMPYSLSVESYQNIENKTMACIYFQYLIPEEARIQYTAYTTVEATPVTDYAAVFSDFNLSNCTAVLLCEENEALELFFSTNAIPVIPCFETVINNCMVSIFNIPAVNDAFKKTLELFDKHDCASMLESVPEVYEEMPWSKFNFLQFVQDNLAMVDEENSEANEIRKQLVTFLSPLKITLETIPEESLPLCSLMKPLSRKLNEEYFSSYFCETEALTEVKNIVTRDLTQIILSNIFLSEASLMDPRFQSVTVENENLQEIKESIEQRFEHLLANNEAEEKPIKSEAKSNPRKSSLKLLFSRGSEQETKPLLKNVKRSLDYEIMKYTAETGADLELCPMKWWEENEFVFQKLRKIASYYMCVPCCATNLFKKTLHDRTTIMQRRFMLRKSIAKQMWFLHYNKDFLEKLKIEEQAKK